MASRIAGITIQLGADTTKLSSALRAVNGTIRQTSVALKDVDKLLKFKPTSTELLSQKQHYLQTEIQATKEKLQQEKAAMEQLKQAGDTEENQEQQRALAREIIETEQRLEALEKEYKQFGSVAAQKMKAVGENMKEIGTKMTAAGKSLTTHVTGPIVAIGAASIAAFKQVDEGLDTVATKTGATGKELEDMQQMVKNIATTIPTEFSTAGEAVGEVNTRFGLTGQALEDLSTKFIKFADINNTDVSTSIDNVQKVMDAYGVEAEDAGKVLDALNKVGQDTGISMDDLSQSLVTNSASLHEMGLDVYQAATLLGNLEKSGVDSTTAMTGFKTAVKNAAKEGKTLPDALGELQKKMDSSASDTEKLNAAIDLFGGRAGPALYEACKTGVISFDELATGAEDSLGSVDETFDNTLDGVDEWKVAFNKLKTVGADLGATLQTTLAPAVEWLSDKLQSAKEKFDGLSEGQKKAIVIIALVVAAIGPLLVVIGGLITAVGTVMTFLPLLAGPVGIVIAAIAAVIAIVVLLITHWDWVKEKASEVAAWVSEKWEALKENVKNAVEDLKTSISEKWNALKEGVTTTVEAIKTGVTNKWNELKTNVTDAVNAVKTGLTNTWNNIKTSVTNTVNGIKTNITNAFTNAKNNVLNIFESIKSGIRQKIDAAKQAVQNAIDRIKSIVNFSWSLPHLKMPHPTVSGKFSLNPPSVPHFGISWYDRGGIFRNPSIIGVGEKRPEFVGALDDLRKIFREESGINALVSMGRQLMTGGATSSTSTFAPVFNNTFNTQPGQDPKEFAAYVAKYMNDQLSREWRAYA